METALPIAVLAGLALLIGLQWSLRPRTRAWRALRRTKNIPIAEIRDGARARITGTVSAVGKTIRSPIGETPCIGYRLEIERLDRRYQHVLRREECGAFAIADESGQATIEGPVLFGLDWENDWSVLQQRWYGVLDAAGVLTHGLLFRRHFAYRQALLQAGDRVTACGVANLEPDPTAPAVDTRSPSLRPFLRGTRRERIAVADARGPAGSRPNV